MNKDHEIKAITQRVSIVAAYIFGFILGKHSTSWWALFQSLIISLIFVFGTNWFRAYRAKRKQILEFRKLNPWEQALRQKESSIRNKRR